MEITGKRGPEGVVKAVCTSEKKGVEKHSVPEGHFLKDFGIEGDAHAGKWHRQVSLLSYDKVKEFNERGAQVEDGAFGENLVVEGIDFRSLPVGMMIYIGDVVLRMTQIGKECHSHCAIYKRMGECIMPREGVFAEVLQEGTIHPGDTVITCYPDENRPFQAAVITLSDKGAKGERVDESGPAAKEMLEQAGYEVVETLILPDEPAMLKTQLMRLADGRQLDLSFKEFELLTYFMENQGIALSREKILNNVWNYDYFGDARTIDTHVKKLRSKLGDKGDMIKTIWGMGYKFEVA